MGCTEIGWEDVDWIDVVHVRNKWEASYEHDSEPLGPIM
jgi:hypothetical protein